MKIFAHRGNLDGNSGGNENKPIYLLKAIEKGFGVEVDVWVKEDKIYFGHDEPEYEVDKEFIDKISPNAIFHAKNVEALNWLQESKHHYFWHNQDDYTMSSRGIVVVYPGKKPPSYGSIISLPELHDQDPYSSKCYGVITDYPFNYV
jgi:hypothetical protein